MRYPFFVFSCLTPNSDFTGRCKCSLYQVPVAFFWTVIFLLPILKSTETGSKLKLEFYLFVMILNFLTSYRILSGTPT